MILITIGLQYQFLVSVPEQNFAIMTVTNDETASVYTVTDTLVIFP